MNLDTASRPTNETYAAIGAPDHNNEQRIRDARCRLWRKQYEQRCRLLKGIAWGLVFTVLAAGAIVGAILAAKGAK